MSSSEEYTEESTDVLQKFEFKDHARLPSLPTHLCPETGERYILWGDIQDNIVGASHLQTYAGRAMFMINKDGELQLDIPLKHLIDKCQYLIEHLETTANGDRFTFRQTIANAQYYHLMATKRLEILDQDRVRALVDGKDRASLLKQLHELEQQMSIWEYRNTCRNMLHGKNCRWEYATSSLFIVLPSDLRRWDDSDSKTHHFRLYFLCDIRKVDSAPKESPQYVHLSNHPGYILDQPLEFLQTYGDYVLRMLRMIKHGYSDDTYEIPSLKTFKILWNCDPNVVGKRLTQKTIQSLVDKALLYLIQLAPPKSIMEPGLTRDQSAAIKASDLEEFGSQLSKAQVTADCTTAVSDLKAAVKKYGLPQKTLVTIYKDTWRAVVDLQKGIFVEVYSQDLCCPRPLLSLGTVQKVTIDRTVTEFDLELGKIIQANKEMSVLNISTKGRNVLYEAERIARLRRNTLRPLCLTLFDRTQDRRGRMVAQVDVEGGHFQAHDIKHDPVEHELLWWDCTLSDHTTSFLDVTTQQRPSVLVSLTLDISRLTPVGLTSVQNVLRRSNLDYLHVLCTPITSDMCDPIAQVLGSIQWPTLKSLVLSGDYIEEWLQLWPPASAPQLMSLRIQGTESVPQELSHSSVLWVHQLVFGAPLADLSFEHVLFQDKSDWALMVESLDMLMLESFDLCETSQNQMMTCSIANKIFKARYSRACTSGFAILADQTVKE
ncbi:hypothetical protein BGZ81_011445 [Podila clonocystis]|nr:hypothetical protein BGZ81_011445 [Podila clonocystis]